MQFNKKLFLYIIFFLKMSQYIFKNFFVLNDVVKNLHIKLLINSDEMS